MKKRLAILGSTGSIGQQTLEVVDNNPDKFEVEVLTANHNDKLLIKQAVRYQPNAVVIANESKYQPVSEALQSFPIKVYAGLDAIEQIVAMENIDFVITALVGAVGLLPTVRAIEAGKKIALANKETLVVGGEHITTLARSKNVPIIPVDSEHSAIYQCLAGENLNSLEKIILTASGGPFRDKDVAYLQGVTREEALQHPNWCMGNKITIDSATLMNKGLEAIEAKWLFNLNPDQIEIIIHPQSIIHSLVQFQDGSMKAQMGLPDMRLPIQYALSFPERYKNTFKRFNFADFPELHFQLPDRDKFPNLRLAYTAMEKGGNMPCILNAANEIAVAAFLNDEMGFMDMPKLVEKVMEKSFFIGKPDLEDLYKTNDEARKMARSLIG